MPREIVRRHGGSLCRTLILWVGFACLLTSSISLTTATATTEGTVVDPDLEPGFPVTALATTGSINRGGPAIHTLVGDIDADPELEILTTALQKGPLYAWNHDGSQMPGWPPKDAPLNQVFPALGQLDPGDPDLEPFAGHFRIWDWTVLVAYDDDGTPLSGWPRPSPPGLDSPPSLADINGDGIDEAFVVEDDVFGYGADGSVLPGWPQHSQQNIRTTPAIGDLDGDGDFEVVAITETTTPGYLLWAWRHDGTPMQGFPLHFESWEDVRNMFPAMGDVDGDGEIEIVMAGKRMVGQEFGHYIPVVHVVDSRGAIERTIPLPTLSISPPALADLDNDAVPEIILQSNRYLMAVRGDGTTLPGWPVDTGGIDYAHNTAPVVGDIDGDGAPDVATIVQTYSFLPSEVHAYDANGMMLPRFPKALSLVEMGAVPAIADIDLDGRNELIVTGDYTPRVSGYYDKVWVYDMHGGDSYGPIEWGQFGGDARHRSFYPTSSSPSASLPTADEIPPHIEWAPGTTPSGSLIEGNFFEQVVAYDNVAISHVDFLVDGKLVRRAKAYPFNVEESTRDLAEGTVIRLTAQATDVYGNQASTGVVSLVVDNRPPDTRIEAGPSGTVSEHVAEFAFSADEAKASFECQLDGSPFESCSSPRRYENLSFGDHSFGVRATGVFERVEPSPATRRWMIAQRHQRSVSLGLGRHLWAKGRATVAGGYTRCARNMPVVIQRRTPLGWHRVRTVDTGWRGQFRVRLPDAIGRYRATAPRHLIERNRADLCTRARSKVVRHEHSP